MATKKKATKAKPAKKKPTKSSRSYYSIGGNSSHAVKEKKRPDPDPRPFESKVKK